MSRGIFPDNRSKIIVWITLGKLSINNGLLYKMESSQDISLDSYKRITFSSKGRGLAVLLLLNI